MARAGVEMLETVAVSTSGVADHMLDAIHGQVLTAA